MKKIFLAGLTSLLLTACVDDKSAAPAGFDVQGMLRHTADNIIIPQYQKLSTETAALEQAINDSCNEITSTAKLSAAQTLWQQAAGTWQQAAIYQVGPILDIAKGSEPNATYNFQLVDSYSAVNKLNPDILDQNMYFYQLSDTPLDILSKGTSENILGFPALEFLLFSPSPETLNTTDQNTVDAWQALPDDNARKTARCEYSKKIANRLSRDIAAFTQTWENSYRSEFVHFQSASLTQLSDALFYLDTQLKDLKLAQSLGINDKCSNNCAENAQAKYAKYSLQLIHANLQGFLQIYSGANGFGFDDIISTIKEQPQVSKAFITDTKRAIDLTEKLISNNQDLYTLASTINVANCTNAAENPDSGETVCHLYGQIAKITDRLKTDFVLLVDTDIPTHVQGDGD